MGRVLSPLASKFRASVISSRRHNSPLPRRMSIIRGPAAVLLPQYLDLPATESQSVDGGEGSDRRIVILRYL